METVNYTASLIRNNCFYKKRQVRKQREQGICPTDTTLQVIDDSDFVFKVDCALKVNDFACVVFGLHYCPDDHLMFEFVRRQAQVWKKYVEFVLVTDSNSPISAQAYRAVVFPQLVIVKKGEGIVYRINYDEDYRAKLNQYIENRNKEDLKLVPTNTVLFAENDDDFKKKLNYGQNKYGMVAIAFIQKTKNRDVEMSDFIQSQAEPWNLYAGFLQVDIDKCQETANKYHISSVPVFVFQENDQIANRIDGVDYRDQLNDYMNPDTRVARAVDDSDFEKRLADADKNNDMVVIVFGDESVTKDKEVFKFVQKQAKEWTKYAKFLKVDIKECDKTAEKFHITSGPAFVFRENFHEAHRIIDKDYKKELSAFIVPEHRLLYAFNDAEFPEKLKVAKNRMKPVVGLVFGHGSSDSEMFKFVQIQAVPWNEHVVFLKVDMDKCSNTPKNFGIATAPTFVFLRDDDVTTGFKRIIGTDYQAELNEFVGVRHCNITPNV